MKITWDEPKRQANLVKHRLDFADLTVDFFLGAKFSETRSQRFKAISSLNGMTVSVIFRRLVSEAIAVISTRRASIKERRLV